MGLDFSEWTPSCGGSLETMMVDDLDFEKAESVSSLFLTTVRKTMMNVSL
jgi:hypothetical protein